MKIGFIGFGEVGSTLAEKLLKSDTGKDDIKVLSSLEDRSEKTKVLLEKISKTTKSEIILLKSFEELALESDILISSTSPSEALPIAEKYGIWNNRIFLDLNNISPDTTLKIKETIENTFNNTNSSNNANLNNNTFFVKGGIIGKITSKDSVIYLSGKKAKELKFLKDCDLNIKIISEDVVDVAYIKMLRSIYTKGVTAILYEVFDISKELGLTEKLFEALSITEGKNFESKSKSRIESLYSSYKRKFEELDEISEFLKNYYEIHGNHDIDSFDSNSKMIEATRNKLRKIK